MSIHADSLVQVTDVLILFTIGVLYPGVPNGIEGNKFVLKI